jgi:hypothetical protein
MYLASVSQSGFANVFGRLQDMNTREEGRLVDTTGEVRRGNQTLSFLPF